MKYICSDDDGSIINIVKDQEGATHIIIYHDPGHRQKNLLRALKAKLGEGPYVLTKLLPIGLANFL